MLKTQSPEPAPNGNVIGLHTAPETPRISFYGMVWDNFNTRMFYAYVIITFALFES
jgi:hypothetical protein